jgi:transposase
MAMGKGGEQAGALWVYAPDLPRSPGHPFYGRLNEVLKAAGFDRFVEKKCARFYSAIGRPSLQPGRYFRLFLLGYFEELDSERGMAWRAADSLAVRSFLGLGLEEKGPDHSTISRTRRLIDVETHLEVFRWVLEQLVAAGLVSGKTVSVDATTLEANAAMRSIVRRDTGERYEQYLKRLAEASGVKTPTRVALARLDRRRQKKGSNQEWVSPSDPDARITKTKAGRTRLAHKAEHAVDLDHGVVVAVTVQPADAGDTATIRKTLAEADENLNRMMVKPALSEAVSGLQEVVTDKGYHSTEVLLNLEEQGLRAYVSEPDRGRRRWKGDRHSKAAVYANRRRIRGQRGQRLHRLRAEKGERSFAHAYETGGLRRTHVRGHQNIAKRLLVHVAGLNLGILMRTLFGIGTPRGLQGRRGRFVAFLLALYRRWRPLLVASNRSLRPAEPSKGDPAALLGARTLRPVLGPSGPFTTGC